MSRKRDETESFANFANGSFFCTFLAGARRMRNWVERLVKCGIPEKTAQRVVDFFFRNRRTIELITAIYKAGAERKTAELPLSKDDPFYTVEGIRAHVPHFYEKTASVMELTGELTFGADFKQGGKEK